MKERMSQTANTNVEQVNKEAALPFYRAEFLNSNMKKTGRCQMHRAHNGLLDRDEKSNIFYETVIQREAVKLGLSEKNKLVRRNAEYTEAQRLRIKAMMAKYIKEQYDQIDYANSKQRDLNAEMALKATFRYVDWETRYAYFGYPMETLFIYDIKINGVRPTIVFIDEKNKIIEGVYLKATKPKMTQSGAKADEFVLSSLEMANLMYYLSELKLPMNEQWELRASTYYLYKKEDKNDDFNPIFKELGKDGTYAGGNILTMFAHFTKSPTSAGCLYQEDKKPCRMADGSTDKAMCPYMMCCAYASENEPMILTGKERIRTGVYKDIYEPFSKVFQSQYEEFARGTETCDKATCERCNFFHLCNFKKAPVTIEEEVHVKSGSISPSAEQMAVIEAKGGIFSVNAGAGAGKTFSMTYKVAKDIDEGMDPKEIAMFTFTDAAAKEMKKRVEYYLEDLCVDGVTVDDMICTTFNSFGNALIQEYYEELGFTDIPTVLPTVTRSRIISDILCKENVIEKVANGLNYKAFRDNSENSMGAIAQVSTVFNMIKENNFSVADIVQLRSKLSSIKGCATIPGNVIETLFDLYYEFDAYLHDNNYIEFTDQTYLIFELLKKDPTVLERFNLKEIIIDEFQDTNSQQLEIIKELMKNPNFETLMVVGDDSQAIYGFRGCTSEIFVNFEQYIGHPVKQLFLLDNYRSQAQIIDFANKINAKNTMIVAKNLVAKKPAGKPVVTRGFWTDKEETEYMADKIEEWIRKGIAPEDIAVIEKDSNLLSKIGNILTERNIPWIAMFPEGFLGNSRCVAVMELAKVWKQLTAYNSARIYLNCVLDNTLLEREDREINRMVEDLINEISEARRIGAPSERFDAFFGFIDRISEEDEILEELKGMLKNLPSLQMVLDYLRDMETFGKGEKKKRMMKYPGVVLTTSHSSKGLEWDYVINSLDKYDSMDIRKYTKKSEEARRLLFVSATRAKEELVIVGKYEVLSGEYNRYLIESYEAAGNEFAPGEKPSKAKAKSETAGTKKAVARTRKKATA